MISGDKRPRQVQPGLERDGHWTTFSRDAADLEPKAQIVISPCRSRISDEFRSHACCASPGTRQDHSLASLYLWKSTSTLPGSSSGARASILAQAGAHFWPEKPRWEWPGLLTQPSALP